jgi:hypothetical protein
MQFDKKNILIIIIIIVMFLIFKKMSKSKIELFTIALKKAADNFSKSVLVNIEKIYRLESDNFKSGQFTGTNTPGMEAFSDTYPYGWNSLNNYFWSFHPEYAPIGTKEYIENGTGKVKKFIILPSVEAGIFTLGAFLEQNSNNPGRWFSTEPFSQNIYNDKILNISTPILNSIS